MPRYEAHITCDQAHARTVEKLASDLGPRWVYSVIAGCPLLGQGTYCYLTTYGTDVDVVRALILHAETLLAQRHVPVLRAKIERIVYDTRTGVDETAFETSAAR